MSLPDKAKAARIAAAKRETKSRQSHRQPEFTQAELQAMHSRCIKYRNIVQAGGTPTPEQDARFLKFQRVTYAMGVACG